MQNRLGRIDVGEEVLETTVDKSRWQQAWSAGKRCEGAAVETELLGQTGQLSMSLILSQFGENLCAASFWTLLLRNSIVGACKACGDAVFARTGAFSNAFDFSAVAAVVECVSSACSE